jgi:2-polyprenyl-6-methoxyphenol hydroxylase-like FAD-dependent oxidoreductase
LRKSCWNIIAQCNRSAARNNAAHALKEALKVDVAIIGAGISGAFMAHAFAPRCEWVVVLDRRAPGMGSTHASTAMLRFEIDTPLIELAGRIGHARAAQAWVRPRRGVEPCPGRDLRRPPMPGFSAFLDGIQIPHTKSARFSYISIDRAWPLAYIAPTFSGRPHGHGWPVRGL